MKCRWIGVIVAAAIAGCQYTDGQGNTHTLGLAPVDHNVSIQPNTAPEHNASQIKAVLENAPSDGKVPLLDGPSGADIGYGLNDDEVVVLGSTPGWYNVRFESQAEGWIDQDYVRRLN